MATTQRFYYSDAIGDFLSQSPDTIVGTMMRGATADINKRTSQSWFEEIEVMKEVLYDYVGRGHIYMEYNIPRMGKRVDVIAMIDGIIFVIEFKTSEQHFSHDATMQVWDYAIDLKNFHEGSLYRYIVPILVCPKEKDDHCNFKLIGSNDRVYRPLLSNRSRLKDCLALVLNHFIIDRRSSVFEDNAWGLAGYSPTPTIIEAAVALYEHHTVAEITRHDGEIEVTAQKIDEIIKWCRENKRKAICFVTGVPGAGKTLIGLQTAIKQFNEGEKAVYLSGNFPLVQVLQEALTRDYVRRSKEQYKLGQSKEKPCTKKEARSQVKAFIQMIHHYRDLYLEGVEAKDGTLVPKEGYFQKKY